MPQIGSIWIAMWAKGRPDALRWTVKGATECSVYISSPMGRTPGHLLSLREFLKDYCPFVPECGLDAHECTCQ